MKIETFAHRTEQALLVGALALAALFPLIDAIGRPLGGLHITGSAAYVQQLTLWLAFVGGLVATRDRKHLTLSTAELLGDGAIRRMAQVFACSVAAVTVAVLTYGSAAVVAVNRQEGRLLPIGLPEWVSECVMPAALALMAVRFLWQASRQWRSRGIALVAVGGAFALGLLPESALPHVWPLTLAVVFSEPCWALRCSLPWGAWH